jgi:hypothetical protein
MVCESIDVCGGAKNIKTNSRDKEACALYVALLVLVFDAGW